MLLLFSSSISSSLRVPLPSLSSLSLSYPPSISLLISIHLFSVLPFFILTSPPAIYCLASPLFLHLPSSVLPSFCPLFVIHSTALSDCPSVCLSHITLFHSLCSSFILPSSPPYHHAVPSRSTSLHASSPFLSSEHPFLCIHRGAQPCVLPSIPRRKHTIAGHYILNSIGLFFVTLSLSYVIIFLRLLEASGICSERVI